MSAPYHLAFYEVVDVDGSIEHRLVHAVDSHACPGLDDHVFLARPTVEGYVVARRQFTFPDPAAPNPVTVLVDLLVEKAPGIHHDEGAPA